MRVVHLWLGKFRCFSNLELYPRAHVGLIGPPGCGRSTVVDALSLVLDPNSLRNSHVDDFDFNARNLGEPIVIEVVLAELGEELEQHFLTFTEPWDSRR